MSGDRGGRLSTPPEDELRELESHTAASRGPSCNFPTAVTVPAGEYFVLGDNLPASDDSRFWGPVRRSWLIGVVRVGG